MSVSTVPHGTTPGAGKRQRNMNLSSLGDALRVARQRANLSQGALAARLGVSQGTISFWERDVELPTLDHLLKLLVEFPELLDAVRTHNHEMLMQLRRIERIVFNGQCACENCNCTSGGGGRTKHA